MTFDAELADNSLHVKANGELHGFDPGAISDKPALKGEVGGTVNVDATLRKISSGVTPETIELMANGTLTDSSIFGGQIPQLMFDAALVKNALHVKANGEVHGFDPGAISDTPALKGDVGGTVDVDATLRNVSSGVTPDSVEATGKIDLQPSVIGGLSIDSAVIDGDYRDSTGVIRMVDVKGHDINLSATGTIALNETGQSKLTFHADTPSLEVIGKLVDRPLHGIASVDGTLTGNKRELQAAGHLMANDAAYGDTSTLTLSTDYKVTVRISPSNARSIDADTAATFVTVARQNIQRAPGQDTMHNKQLIRRHGEAAPARSAPPGHSGRASGSPGSPFTAAQSPDTQGLNWQLTPGSEATIQYAEKAIAVQNLKLISGDQRIAAEDVRAAGRRAVGDAQQRRPRRRRRVAAAAAAVRRPRECVVERSPGPRTRRVRRTFR